MGPGIETRPDTQKTVVLPATMQLPIAGARVDLDRHDHELEARDLERRVATGRVPYLDGVKATVAPGTSPKHTNPPDHPKDPNPKRNGPNPRFSPFPIS